jgi:hypothetical protein
LTSSIKGTRVGGFTAKINAGLGLIAKFHGHEKHISKRDWEMVDHGQSIRLKYFLYRSVKMYDVFCVRYLLALGSMVIFRPRKGTVGRKIGPLSYATFAQPMVNRGRRSMDPVSALSWKKSTSSIFGPVQDISASDIERRLSRPSMFDLDMMRGSGLFGILYTKQPHLIEVWSPTRSLSVVQHR